jgi:hypothetical protein
MNLPRAIVNNPMAIASRNAPATDIGALVSAREMAEREAHNRSELMARARRAKVEAKIARREDRLSKEHGEDFVRISIAPKHLGDMLRDQWFLGFVYSFIGPGAFVMGGLAKGLHYLGASVGLILLGTVGIWVVLLTMMNVVYALCTRRRLTLDIMHSGYYSLYGRNPKRPILFGQVPALNVDVNEKEGRVCFGDAHGRLDVDLLTRSDLETLGRTRFT